MLRLVSFAKKETPLLGNRNEANRVPKLPSFDDDSGVLWKDGVLRSFQPGQHLAGQALARNLLQLPVETTPGGRIKTHETRVLNAGDSVTAGKAQEPELASFRGDDDFAIVGSTSGGTKVKSPVKWRASGEVEERPQTAGSLRSGYLVEDGTGWPANGRWMKTAEEDAEDLRKGVNKLAIQLDVKEQELAEVMKQLAAAEALVSSLSKEGEVAQGRISTIQSEFTFVTECKQELEKEATARSADLEALARKVTAVEKALEAERAMNAKSEKMRRDEAAAYEKELNNLQAVKAALGVELVQRDAEVGTLQRSLESAFLQTSQLQAEVVSLKEQLEKHLKAVAAVGEHERGAGVELRTEIDRLKTEVSSKADECRKALADIEQLKRDLEQKNQQEVQLTKLLERTEEERDAQRRAVEDKDMMIQELKTTVTCLELAQEKMHVEVGNLKQQKKQTEEEAFREKAYLQQTLGEAQLSAAAAVEEAASLKEQMASTEKQLADLEEDLKVWKVKAGEVEESTKLRLALQKRTDKLKAYKGRLKEVEEILMQLGYEKEGAKAPDSSSSFQEVAVGKGSSPEKLSDVEKAGTWVMKHCVSVEALKKEHELATKLSRRQTLNLQQEVEQLKKSLWEKEQMCSDLKTKILQQSNKEAEESTKDNRRGAKTHPAEVTTQWEFLKSDSVTSWHPHTLKDDSATTPLVSRSAGEKVKATANVLLQKIATSKLGADCAAPEGPKKSEQAEGSKKNQLASSAHIAEEAREAAEIREEKENGQEQECGNGGQPEQESRLKLEELSSVDQQGTERPGPSKLRKKKSRGKQ